MDHLSKKIWQITHISQKPCASRDLGGQCRQIALSAFEQSVQNRGWQPALLSCQGRIRRLYDGFRGGTGFFRAAQSAA
jgi:hypothetical protein